MTPAQLSRTVVHVVRSAVQAGELPVPADDLSWLAVETAAVDGGSRSGIVQVPPRPGSGDFASPLALRLAAASGRAPRDVAEVLRHRLVREPGIARVDVAGPGFLNITLESWAHVELVREVLAQGPTYGRGCGLAGMSVRLRSEGGPRATVVAEVVERMAVACGADTSSGGRSAVLADQPQPLRVREPGVALAELEARLGRDGARWALLRAAAHDAPHCDPAEVLAQRESNPLFRVRYAHARTCAVLRNGRELGVEPHPGDPGSAHAGAADPAVPLLALLADFPRVVEAAARRRAPDRLAREMELVADSFFRFHDGCPALPRGAEKPSAVHRSRLAIAAAAGTVLANGLSLLGISAPAHL
ncbi:ArgS-related anticodon-binding protein NrtL [Streptomyces zagrosensis]|uniref:arginine--tRNA ligase n=1 Tax=Streptomyces zagrosensis TaxID=1042984 RepID=A0A7W9Q8S8_9ACTN|nr:DALR anticodon-binding domain-containing protein [Streptomyces zagrosensis]MBB5935738.1 arginyl-tRNA synthetase [Streptomyces zagrosensis]